MVDKVFADWQKKSQSKSPELDAERIIQPFGWKEYNKYTLTNIPPAETLDFESNLCYCYDCDLEQDFHDVKLPERTGEFLPGGQRYIHRVLQTILMKLILLWVRAERAVLGRAKTALKFKYEI